LGFDTLDANLKLGFKADERDYTLVADLLKDRGVNAVNLLTNNPLKIESLKKNGIDVISRIPLEGSSCSNNFEYLNTKKERMGHLLSIRR